MFSESSLTADTVIVPEPEPSPIKGYFPKGTKFTCVNSKNPEDVKIFTLHCTYYLEAGRYYFEAGNIVGYIIKYISPTPSPVEASPPLPVEASPPSPVEVRREYIRKGCGIHEGLTCIDYY